MRYGQAMTNSSFTILLGGHCVRTDRVMRAVSGSRVIAADGGMRHARLFDVTPELWVGDFDSSSEALSACYPDVERMPYPAAKNETDGAIAVSEALSRGARQLLLVGALGGERSDHALMHLIHGLSLAKAGHAVTLTSGEEEAHMLLPGTLELDLPKGSLFSILGFSPLKGLSIVDARYPLADFSLPFGSSRTISNVAEGPVRLLLGSGEAVVLCRPYDLTGA